MPAARTVPRARAPQRQSAQRRRPQQRPRLKLAHKSAGKPVRRGIRWERVPRNWLIAIVLVMAVLYVPPLHSYWRQRQDTATAKAELQRLAAEHRALKARARALRRGSTIEMEARKLGMVKADERAYVILR